MKPRKVTKREQQIIDAHRDEELLFADGFSDAILGVVSRIGTTAVCYDFAACVRILTRDGKLSYEEAIEHMDFNVTGAYVGEHTPFFLNHCKPE